MRPLFAVAVFLLLSCHVFLGLTVLKNFSATYDEPVHLTAGYAALKVGDYSLNGLHHPPFGEMWAALPLLALKPMVPMGHPAWIGHRWTPSDQYAFADTFLFKNRVDADRLLFAGRAMQIVLSCLLGLFIAWIGFVLAGAGASLVSLSFWAFSPTFLANGTLVSTDLAFAVFFSAFFMFQLIPVKKIVSQIILGIFLGLCFASKFLAVAVVPIWTVLLVLKKEKAGLIPRVATVLASALVTLALIYRFSDFDVFWKGIGNIFVRSQTGRSSFFWGTSGADGSPLYFPAAFAIKTSLPFLVGLAAAAVGLFVKKKRLPMDVWLPPLLFFVLCCFSKVQIGHRHILAIYPFLTVIAGVGLSALLEKKIGIAAALVAWSAVEAWNVKPDFLSYFNAFVGGPSQGYRYLTDSNNDWGQGLKQLGRWLADKNVTNGIYLCYFGVVDPHAYGIAYLDIGSDKLVAHQDDTALNLSPTCFAVSVTNLQATYYRDKTAFAWLSAYTPAAHLANSIFVYDFSSAPEALAKLKEYRP